MRIVLLGPPGSGKAELSRMISSHYGMSIITVSSVMQRAAAEQSELGRLAKEAMDMSRVSDELLLALLRIQLPQMDLSKGFVLVDLPKNAGQADVLDSLLSDLGASIELVLNLEVDPDELMERLVGRIACDNCGAQYNLYVNPPLVDGVCDECGARVVRRPHDYEETISNRLRVYEAQMGPLLQYYHLNNSLQRLAADEGPDAAWKVLRGLIDELERSRPVVSVTEEPSSATKAEPGGTTQPKAKKPVSAVNQTGKEAGRKKATAKSDGGADRVSANASPGAGKQTTRRAVPAKVAGAATKSTKETAKKSPIKKATTKKAAAKQRVAKKAPTKQAPTKRVSAKQSAAKKTVAKKTASKKSLVKKPAAKKRAAPKKAAAKKATVKKVAPSRASTKRPVSKKAAAKKVSDRKVAAKKTPTKRPATKKAPVKKALAKKPVANRAASKAKKAPAVKRPVAKKAATAKVKTAQKPASKRPAAAKPSAKKKVQKKAKTSAKKAQRR